MNIRIWGAALALMGALMTMTESRAEPAQGAGGAPAGTTAVRLKIDAGTLVGFSDGQVNTFRGVPYARPPVGPLRWRMPQQPAHWTGDRDATHFALPCPQPVPATGVNGGGVSGATSEDCLYINVTVPKNARNAPVFVWLHGGAAYLGAGHLGGYNGEAFARNGVIVVTVNYRLGAFGAFAHPALTAANGGEPLVNYALMDAIEVLKWVKRNARALGADANNVTVGGQSAGGSMVSQLLASPAASGLFAKAVIESGSNLRGGIDLAAGEAKGVEAATALGLPGANATADQLRAIPAGALVANAATRTGIRGVIDGKIVTGSLQDAYAAGTAADVPTLVGSNNGEPGAGAARTLAGLAAAGSAPSYLYNFAYVPEWRKPAQPNGAPHSAEIVYVFDSWGFSSAGDPRVNADDKDVSRRLNLCWTAFFKSTNATRALSCEGFSWPAYSAEADDAALFGRAFGLIKAGTIQPPPMGAPRGSMAPN